MEKEEFMAFCGTPFTPVSLVTEQPASPVETPMIDEALESSGLETNTLVQSPMDVDLPPPTPVKEAQQPEPGPSGSTRAATVCNAKETSPKKPD